MEIGIGEIIILLASSAWSISLLYVVYIIYKLKKNENEKSNMDEAAKNLELLLHKKEMFRKPKSK